MTATELAKLVKQMRDAQRAYFRERTSERLSEAKGLEARVDEVVAQALAGPSLFDTTDPFGPEKVSS